MATVSYWSGSWASAGPDDDLQPGEEHDWIMWGFDISAAISITVQPVVGNPFADRVLQVENIQSEGATSGRRIFYTVRNAGPDTVIGYLINFGFISG